MNFFIVDLEVAATNKKFHVAILLINEAEDMSEAVRDDSSEGGVIWHAQHGVCLSTAGLAVRKNGSIVALDDGLHEWKCTFIVNRLLLGIGVVH